MENGWFIDPEAAVRSEPIANVQPEAAPDTAGEAASGEASPIMANPVSQRRGRRLAEDVYERPDWLPEGWKMDVKVRTSGATVGLADRDVSYESLEPGYHLKHFVARRESPWKVDGDSTGVSSKLKLLEHELLNLEKVGKPYLSKMPSLLRKQAKRDQTLAGKIDDLCRRMCMDLYLSQFDDESDDESSASRVQKIYIALRVACSAALAVQ